MKLAEKTFYGLENVLASELAGIGASYPARQTSCKGLSAPPLNTTLQGVKHGLLYQVRNV